MTFSITARCARTGQFGVAVSSSSPAVGARCAHVRAGVGAVASQNVTDPRLGPRALDLMAGGLTAPEALARIGAEAPHLGYRQLALVDAAGGTAAHTGAQALGLNGARMGAGAVAAGNMLSAPEVLDAMLAAFAADPAAHLGTRLLAAMRAALVAGGEAGPVHSFGLVLADRQAWPLADLRVDWTEGDPVAEGAALWDRWRPQMDDYVTRALDPTAAPSYGVPGDP